MQTIDEMTTTRCPYCAEEIRAEAVKCKHCGSWIGQPPAYPGMSPSPLTRSSADQWLFGVCGGAARYFRVDSTLLRAAATLVTVFTGFVPGIVTYFVLAAIMPTDDAPA
jgi:phage shock protein C